MPEYRSLPFGPKAVYSTPFVSVCFVEKTSPRLKRPRLHLLPKHLRPRWRPMHQRRLTPRWLRTLQRPLRSPA